MYLELGVFFFFPMYSRIISMWGWLVMSLSLGLHLLSCCYSHYVVPPWSCLPRKTLTSSLSALLSFTIAHCSNRTMNTHTHTHTHTFYELCGCQCAVLFCVSPSSSFNDDFVFVLIVIVHYPQTSKGADFVTNSGQDKSVSLLCRPWTCEDYSHSLWNLRSSSSSFFCFEVKFEQNPFDCCKSFALLYRCIVSLLWMYCLIVVVCFFLLLLRGQIFTILWFF
jgi:hypothetical protein